MTHAPKVIFVPHIIPNIGAFSSFAQLGLYKKIFPKHHTVASEGIDAATRQKVLSPGPEILFYYTFDRPVTFSRGKVGTRAGPRRFLLRRFTVALMVAVGNLNKRRRKCQEAFSRSSPSLARRIPRCRRK